jgi:Domain of unknown function (DUF4260)
MDASHTPAVAGVPRLVLHLEGAALLAFALGAYAWSGASWWLFAALFWAPDIAFLAYLIGPRAGSIVYNALHTTLCPAALVALAVILGDASLATVWAAIWAAHIGYDRLGGWGLKYGKGYWYTHLGELWWPLRDQASRGLWDASLSPSVLGVFRERLVDAWRRVIAVDSPPAG